jgi:hypothetical protein
MIIVSERILVKPGSRATFLKATNEVVATARRTIARHIVTSSGPP